MKTPNNTFLRLRGGLILLAWLAIVTSLPAQSTYNWRAFNEHRPSTEMVANGWPVTAANVTGYDMGAPADTMGVLTDFETGDPLAVSVIFTRTGGPDDFGAVGRPVRFDTPMGDLFYGICDLSNDGLVGVRADPPNTDNASLVSITFTNLDTSKRYVFRGSVARNGGYGNRWSVARIVAESWTDAHINGSGGPGILTINSFPASLLAVDQAAFNSGANNEGAVVGWNDIEPHSDGTFTITCTQYTGAIPGGTANGPYGYSFGALMLAEEDLEPPVITADPPALTTVEENRPFSLHVDATGTPLNYQWYKNGSPIEGATFATYQVAKAQLGDSGDYYVEVFNSLDTQTSAIAQVSVFADTEPPAVETVFSYPTVDTNGVATLNQIIVEFTEAVTSESVGSPSNYNLLGTGNPSSVVVTNERSVVLVMDSPLTEDTDYTISLSGATDEVGNMAGISEASFHTWVSGFGNGLIMESFPVEDPAITVESLLADPDYPDNPDRRDILRAFDTRLVYPTDDREGYGARIRGVFIPPVSGDWVFFARTRQLGVVNLNPNGIEESGKLEILRQSTENAPFNWDRLTSSLYPLRAGQAYFIEGLYKGAVGEDYLKVAARLAGTGVPMPVDSPLLEVDANSLAGGIIGNPLAPRDLGGGLTIMEDLADQTVEENHPFTMSITLDNPSGLPVAYQWYKNDAPIDGATSSSLSIQPVLADHNSVFRVEAGKLGSTVISRTATLSVDEDVTPPEGDRVISGASDLSSVQVVFNELMDPATVNDYLVYSLIPNAVTEAVPQADGFTVTLSLGSPLILGQTYQLIVFFGSDLAGNFIDPGNPIILDFVAGSDSPRLAIELNGNQAIVSWPESERNLVLEETSELLSSPSSIVWTPVSIAPVLSEGRNTVTVTVGTGTRVFRLRE